MKIISFLFFSLAMLGANATTDQQSNTIPETYCNPRFGYCITYDASIFNKIPPDTNRDGITVMDKTGTLFLECYASYNPFKLTVSDLLEENLAYLVRNEPSGPMAINEFKDETTYLISFETEESFFQQELILETYYYKVLTVKVPKRKSAMVQHIMETSHFIKDATMVQSGSRNGPLVAGI